jgi:hypothetical protein
MTNDEWTWPRFDDFASPLCRSATGGSNRSFPIGAEGYTPAHADLTGSVPGCISLFVSPPLGRRGTRVA